MYRKINMMLITRNIIRLLVASCISANFLIAQDKSAIPKCDCPRFTIESNWGTVKAGDIVEFSIPTLETVGPTISKGRFEWTVSLGTIVSGQGTAKIQVSTNQEMLIEPSPTPAPTGVWISSLGRRIVSITAIANFVGGDDCSCPDASASATVDVGIRSELPNRPANVTSLTLGTNRLVTPCEPGHTPAGGKVISKSMLVDVSVLATDPENDVLTYNYTVTGGRIVGTGKNVQWDLSGVAPGPYNITVGADDGCGICGKTKTETIKIAECEPACGLVVCPSISIKGPDTLNGENEFTATVSGGTVETVTFEWTVTNGVILGGQGTPRVKVKLEPTSSVTVKIGGLEGSDCISSESKEFSRGVIKP